MAAQWPEGLQKCIDANTFTETQRPQTIISKTQYGSPKIRRTVTRDLKQIKASIMVDKDSYTTFWDFFNYTLSGGSLRFTFEHPITKDPMDFRFMKEPKLSAIGPLHWRISMEWEEV